MIDSYCYAPSSDPEIIARVKHTGSDPAFYHQIIEAWRANRLTGKFEKVNPKLVTKMCKRRLWIRINRLAE